MTPGRYLLARAALAFGVSRKKRRTEEAAAETHLLREAEQILGQKIWERVEPVEELGNEYWNLRRLVAEQKDITKKLQEAANLLANAHEQRAALLNEKSLAQEQLNTKRTQMLDELAVLSRDREEIVRKARSLRRLYDGLKTKLDVLKSESKEDEQTKATTRARMSELRGKLEVLKADRDQVVEEVSRRNSLLDEVDKELDAERGKHRSEAAEAFQMIGEANRRISSYKAELGLVDTEMNQLFSEIGRYVSRKTKVNDYCRQATADFASMVDVMSALRRSINLNHQLADN